MKLLHVTAVASAMILLSTAANATFGSSQGGQRPGGGDDFNWEGDRTGERGAPGTIGGWRESVWGGQMGYGTNLQGPNPRVDPGRVPTDSDPFKQREQNVNCGCTSAVDW
jgi:hypothetical protein